MTEKDIEPVSALVEVDLLAHVRTTLRCAAEDLTALIDAEYPQKSRETYPSYARKHKNDMEIVTDILYCLDNLPQVPRTGKHFAK